MNRDENRITMLCDEIRELRDEIAAREVELEELGWVRPLPEGYIPFRTRYGEGVVRDIGR